MSLQSAASEAAVRKKNSKNEGTNDRSGARETNGNIFFYLQLTAEECEEMEEERRREDLRCSFAR